MKDKDKTKEQLLDEMAKLRQKNVELEASESEHKWAEQELRESQERYKSLTEASPVGIFHSDSQGDFLYVNERWVEIARLSPEEAYAKGWEKALHPDDKKRILTEWYQSCQEKRPFKSEFRFQPSKGISVWVLCQSSVEKNVNGEVIGYIGTITDITCRKQVEEAIRESEEKYRELVNTSADSVISIDQEMRTTLWNPKAEKIFGYTEEEMLGQSLMKIVPEGHRMAMEKGFAEFQKSGSDPFIGKIIEIKALKKNGIESPIELSISVRKVGDTYIATAIVRDITERRQTQKVQEALYKISEAINLTRDLEGLFRSIHEIIAELMYAKNLYIALYDPADETISFPYFVDELEESLPPRKKGKGLTEYVIRTGKPLLAPFEVFKELEKKGEVELIGDPWVDWLGVPLKILEKTIGVMTVQNYSEDIRYSEKDKDILSFVSTQVAMAIERKQAEEQLKALNEELEATNEELISTNEELNIQTHNLGERLKELSCLYRIDEISRREGITIEEVLKETAQLIPPSWQYPEITGGRITFEGKKYETRNFKKTKWTQSADIIIGKKKEGLVEVCYLEEKPEIDEGPFLKEERDLINAIAERLRQFIERARAEENLKSSEERLRIIFEYAPDGYYLNDFKGNFVDGNKAAAKLTGYKRDELIGKSFLKLKLLSPKDIPKAAALLAKNALGQPTGPDEFTLNRKDGTQVVAEIRTFPVKIKGKALVLGNVRDITERKRATE